MDLKPEKLFAALNQTSETAIKALAFARESRERAEKIAAMVAAFPVIAKGDKGERGEAGQSVDLQAVDQTLKELVAKIPPALQGKPGRDGRDGKDADVKALEARIDTHAATVFPKALETARTAAIDAVPEIVRSELAQAVSQLPKPENGKDGKDGDCACLARVWKGNWDRGTLYQPGDVFGFRGSSYVVLRECRGILPSVAVQRGPNPYYGVLAAAGAPGIANITQGGGASGTVTSVALAAPSFLTVSGSPVTTDGTLTLALATQAANVVFAGPTSGASAAPTFRGLVVDDIPDLTSLYDAQGEADSALVSAVAYTDSEIAALSSVYQPIDSDLTTIAGLADISNSVIQRKSGSWAARTLSQYWTDLMADPTVSAYAYIALPFVITNDKRLLGRDSALPPFTASEISIGTGLTLSSSTLSLDATAAVTSITGTANQVIAAASVGAVTLSLPQAIHTGATPQFAGLGLGAAGISDRIIGDFSNATTSSRLTFISSVTNGATTVQAAPNGTSTIGSFSALNSSAITNASKAQFYASNTAAVFNSGHLDSGTTLPLLFAIDDAEKARLSTATGDFIIGGASDWLGWSLITGRGAYVQKDGTAGFNAIAAGTGLMSQILGAGVGGSLSSQTATLTGQGLTVGCAALDSSASWSAIALIRMVANQDQTASSKGARIVFESTLDSTTSRIEVARFGGLGSIELGVKSAAATNATDGFVYIRTCAGTPTGTPTAVTGLAPLIVDTTNNKLYFYSGGAWRDAGP